MKRIVRNNPQALQNPDFDDKSNTSLHLVSKEGFVEIAVRVSLPKQESSWIVQTEG